MRTVVSRVSTTSAPDHPSATAQVTGSQTGEAWSLALSGTTSLALSRSDLLAMPQHTADLPIACVEGWSAGAQWTGVRVRDYPITLEKHLSRLPAVT